MVEPYQKIVLHHVPRILSMQDRNPFSSTYGCFDRQYWHYKTITDYPSATYQQPVLTLALLYKCNFDGNIYHNNFQILRWTIAGMLFWSNIQNSDGSFNEWYLNEHSFCATSFTTWGISEAFMLLEDELNPSERAIILNSLKKSGDWLLRHNNLQVANQMMAAMHTLYNIYFITKEKTYLNSGEEKKRLVLQSQDEEGWFPEYDGADPGYSLVQLEILTNFYKRTNDNKIFDAINRLLDFIYYFLHPDGTVSGEYGSRGGQYLLPHGLVLASKYNQRARSILDKILSGLENDKVLSIENIDDRYFAYFYINSFTQAFVNNLSDYRPKECEEQGFCRIFKKAGLVALKNDRYYAVVGVSKNGCIRVYQNDQLIYSDAGYFGVTSNGERISSQRFNPNCQWSTQTNDGKLKISLEGKFILFKNDLPLTRYVIPFKLFTRTLLKSEFISEKFNAWVKSNKIAPRKEAGLKLAREITLADSKVEIKDTITKTKDIDVKELISQRVLNLRHTPCSGYFLPSELSLDEDIEQENKVVERLNLKGTVTSITKIRFNDNYEISKDVREG